LRNWLYDSGLKTAVSYDFPVICVGNLSVGGTGKTPMIEYLIRLLKNHYKVATLSRGYGRRTSGFQMADLDSNAMTIGDEPFQFYNKFKDVLVAVDADRRNGIKAIKSNHDPEVILLDDAFQHRSVNAGLNILLTSYGNLYSNDILLPTGDLREPRTGADRADVIVVTKCPKDVSEEKKANIIKSLKPLPKQDVFFSWIYYDEFVYGDCSKTRLNSISGLEVSVVTGIANPATFVQYLSSIIGDFKHFRFKDHHRFSDGEIMLLQKQELIITTEKDYARLLPRLKNTNTILYYLPICFVIDKGTTFKESILKFVNSY